MLGSCYAASIELVEQICNGWLQAWRELTTFSPRSHDLLAQTRLDLRTVRDWKIRLQQNGGSGAGHWLVYHRVP